MIFRNGTRIVVTLLSAQVLLLADASAAIDNPDTGTPYTPAFGSCGQAVAASDRIVNEKQRYNQDLNEIAHRARRISEYQIFTLNCRNRAGQGEQVDLRFVTAISEELQGIAKLGSTLEGITKLFGYSIGSYTSNALKMLQRLRSNPRQTYTCLEAATLFDRWVRSRDAVLASLNRIRDDVFCHQVLTRDLTLNAIHERSLRASCSVDIRGIQYEMRLTGRNPGTFQFWESERLSEAIRYCRAAGHADVRAYRVNARCWTAGEPNTGLSGRNIAGFKAESVFHCQEACDDARACRSVDYNARNGACYLNDLDSRSRDPVASFTRGPNWPFTYYERCAN